MSKLDILLLEPMLESIEAQLDALYTVHRRFAATERDWVPAELAPKVRGIVTGGGIGASRPLVDMLPALEIIGINGIGTDAVDLENARARGIRVSTTPDVLTDDVADLGMGLMISALRGLATGDRFVRAGVWGKQPNLPLAHKVSGKRLGILGMGRIGRAIGRRAEGFGMQISYHDVRRFDDVPYGYAGTLVELARGADVLMVAASGGAQSRGIVNAEVLTALGPEGVLVNIARGSVVDETALVAALLEKRIAGAGLDVFVDEPNVPKALWGMENVVLQPHRASATVETRVAMGELVLANVAACFGGKPLPTAVV